MSDLLSLVKTYSQKFDAALDAAQTIRDEIAAISDAFLFHFMREKVGASEENAARALMAFANIAKDANHRQRFRRMRNENRSH